MYNIYKVVGKYAHLFNVFGSIGRLKHFCGSIYSTEK